MSLIQLIYVSTASRELNDKEIREILDSCVKHNPPQEVTGLLLYSHGSFMQVLEGEEEAVDETMSRIKKDPLHHSINELTRTPIKQRDFGKWSMGFRGVTTADASTWPAYAPFFAFGFKAETIGANQGLALELMRTFADTVI